MTPSSNRLYPKDNEPHWKICACRTCVHSGAHQPLDHFAKCRSNRDGLSARCKDCSRAAYLKGKEPKFVPDGISKVCRKCGEIKLLDYFHKHNGSPDGRRAICIQCRSSKLRSQITKPETTIPLFKICSNSTCKFAGLPQPINNFYRISTKPYRNGVDSQCKDCRSQAAKDFLIKRKDYEFPAEFTRVCTKCGGNAQPIDNFHKCAAKKGGRSTICKSCDGEKKQKYYLEHTEEHAEMGRKAALKNFGTDLKWYEEQLARQNGRCAICKRHESEFTKRLSVDHNHSCCGDKRACDRCRRGLLCGGCNTRLSYIESQWVYQAIAYLNEYGAAMSLQPPPPPPPDSPNGFSGS